MTELLDKNRLERLEAEVRGLKERLADLERTLYILDTEVRRLFEEDDEVLSP